MPQQETHHKTGNADPALVYDSSRLPLSNFLVPAATGTAAVDLSKESFSTGALRKIELAESPLQLSETFQKANSPISESLLGKFGSAFYEIGAVLASFSALTGFDFGRLLGRGWSYRHTDGGSKVREEADLPNLDMKAGFVAMGSLAIVTVSALTELITPKLVPGSLFCAALYATGTALLGIRRG